MNNYRGYVFRIYPTREQELQFGKIFSAVHYVYNELLKAWLENQNLDMACALDQLIAKEPWLTFIDRSILNYARIHLEKACAAFLREHGKPESSKRCLPDNSCTSRQDMPKTICEMPDASEGLPARRRRPTPPGHPRFKTRKDHYASFTISSSNNIYIRYNMLTLGGQQGLKPIRIVQSRPLPRASHICSATVSRHSSGDYYVSIQCRLYREKEPVSRGTAAVGLDYSLPSFFVASDPSLIPDENCLHHWARSREKLASANRKLSHMVPHSHNYEKQRLRIARIHEGIRAQRRDYLQKLSTEIADKYDIVCVETLNLVEMEGQAHHFARRIQDNGWSDFVNMLSYKLKERGKTLVKVSKWFPSSKLCHECGYLYRELKLSDREWDCPSCGAHINRDYNASLNIRDEGLRIILQRRQGTGRTDSAGRSIVRMEYDSRFSHGSPTNSAFREYNPQDKAALPMLDYLYEDTGSYGSFGVRDQTYCDDSWDNDETTMLREIDSAGAYCDDSWEENKVPGISSWDTPLYVSAEEDNAEHLRNMN